MTKLWMVVAACLTVKPQPDWSLVTEPPVYTMRSCGLLFSSMRSSTVLPAGHSRQCFPRFSGMSVSQRRRNRFGYLSHCLVCLSSVSWHTCRTESSAWSIQDLPRPCLHPFVSASWSGLWGFSTTLMYALTCSTFCLVCIGGRSSLNLEVSVGVNLVVPSITRIASFRTLSNFSRFVCAIVVRPSP